MIETPVAPAVKPIETVRPDVGQRRVEKKIVPEDRGRVGRERARREVKQQLAAVTTSLENVLDDVSRSLASTDDGKPAARRTPRRRKTRGGRGAAQLAGVGRRLDHVRPASVLRFITIAPRPWPFG